MLQARLFSYHDTHLHRLGPNYHLLPVNAPKDAPERSYQRDGLMRFDANGGGGPNYWPNSFGGPAPDPERRRSGMPVSGKTGRTPYPHPNDDFEQAGVLYRDVMTDEDATTSWATSSATSNAQERIRLRQCAVFYKADPEYGRRVAEGLGLDVAEVERLAEMCQEERVEATAT